MISSDDAVCVDVSRGVVAGGVWVAISLSASLVVSGGEGWVLRGQEAVLPRTPVMEDQTDGVYCKLSNSYTH